MQNGISRAILSRRSLSNASGNFLNVPLRRDLCEARAQQTLNGFLSIVAFEKSVFARAQTEQGGCVFDERTKKFEGNRKTSSN